jgi:hypothetical protein
MKKTHWDKIIAPMDEINYGPFTHEAQEITLKTWFQGGRCVVNKKTWYAHMHKGKRGKNYGFSNAQYKKHQDLKEMGRLYCIDHWLYTDKYKLNFEQVYEKLGPWPKWPSNWKEQLEVDYEREHGKKRI